MSGPSDDEWDSHATLALVVLAADERTGVAEEVAPLQRVRGGPDGRGAMVRGQDGDGAVGEPERVQRAQ